MFNVVGEGFVGTDGPVVEGVVFEVDVEGGAGLFIVIAFLGLEEVRDMIFVLFQDETNTHAA